MFWMNVDGGRRRIDVSKTKETKEILNNDFKVLIEIISVYFLE